MPPLASKEGVLLKDNDMHQVKSIHPPRHALLWICPANRDAARPTSDEEFYELFIRKNDL